MKGSFPIKCADCKHLVVEHGKTIPERPPSGLHIIVCTKYDTEPPGICDCGGDDIQPGYYDEGCFAKDGGKFCGCVSFLTEEFK